MPVILLILLVTALVAALAFSVRHAQQRQNRWRLYADLHGDEWQDKGPTRAPTITGVRMGVPFTLTTVTRGSGKNQATYTTVRATPLFPLPSGLRVSRQGIGTVFATMFGGQDIEVGDARVDPHLRIQGSVPSDVVELFRHQGAGRALVDLVEACGHALVTDEYVHVERGGYVTDHDRLDALIALATGCVRRLQDALRWNPRDAPMELLPPAGTPTLGLRVDRPEAPDALEPTGAEAPTAAGQTPPTSTAADSLIAELAEGGETVAEGAFTLDREVAREKMQAYQLAEPERYALELTQAAVLRGTERIRIEHDRDDLWIRFGGTPFTLTELEHLYATLFADAEDPETQAVQRLAVGLNAALAGSPTFVHLVSGFAHDAVELELRPGTADRFGPVSDPRAPSNEATEIHVRLPLSQKLAGGHRACVDLLRERCRHAEIPVEIDGDVVSAGLAAEPLRGGTTATQGDLRIHLGFAAPLNGRMELRLVTHGVWIETLRLTRGPAGLRAVAACPRFRRDLSGRQVIRDHTFGEAVTLIEGALPALYAALVEELSQAWTEARREDPALVALLRRLMHPFQRPEDFAEDGPAHALGRAPVWPVAEGRPASMHDLLTWLDESGHVDWADDRMRDLPLRPLEKKGLREMAYRTIWIHGLERADRAYLVRLFGYKLRSRTADFHPEG